MRKLAIGIFFFSLFIVIVQACKTTYQAEQKSAYSTGEPDLANGKKLAIVACGVCHLDNGINKFTGAKMHDVPGFLGEIYAANITQHKEKGIGKYSAGELRYLLRTGIKRNGKIAPFMIRPNLSDKDMEDLIAFLLSDDEMVQPADMGIPSTKYSVMGKMFIEGAKPLPYPDRAVIGPEKADTVAYGKYLIDNLACFHCHSGSMAKVDDVHIELTKNFMAGGAKVLGIDGSAIRAPNLTMDKESGIGNWSIEDFSKAVRQGVSPDKKILRYPMRMYPELTEGDIVAMYRYLDTLLPVYNRKVAHK